MAISPHGHERHTLPVGRHGKPLRKVRLMPRARTHALARKLMGCFGTAVTVL